MTGKVAIVTGASSGIGDATARRLAQLSYTVYAVARRADRMAALKEQGIRTVSADVTDDAALVALVDKIISETGRIDVVVNNAGYGSYGALEDVPIAEARRQFDVNVFGLARLIQLVLPHMRAQRDGYIVNISSIGGKIWEPLGSWYHATKFAVEGLSDCLRMELEPFGIHVVVVEPGAIKTEWGGIAREGMLRYSGGTAYAAQAQAHARMFEGADKSSMASPPEVVADTIAAALRARRPRTRYATGGGAKMILALRRFSSDRGFDWLMRTMERQMAG